jgi:hypothetical protein
VDADGVSVVHAIPGRIRLKVAALRDNPVLAEAIQDRLATVRGIDWVETNPRTGSVLILYEAKRLKSEESVQALSEALQPLFPGLERFDLPALAASKHTNGAHHPVGLDRKITGLLGSLNSSVERATGGADLRVLVPVLLFALGVRSLLVTDQVRFPTWYDFIWFSFGTFLALNPLIEARPEVAA